MSLAVEASLYAGYFPFGRRCGDVGIGVYAAATVACRQSNPSASTNGFIGDYEILILGKNLADHLSDRVKERLNNETHLILEQCSREVEELLKREETLLDRFASELIKRNELEYDEIDAIFAEYGKQHPLHQTSA